MSGGLVKLALELRDSEANDSTIGGDGDRLEGKEPVVVFIVGDAAPSTLVLQPVIQSVARRYSPNHVATSHRRCASSSPPD